MRQIKHSHILKIGLVLAAVSPPAALPTATLNPSTQPFSHLLPSSLPGAVGTSNFDLELFAARLVTLLISAAVIAGVFYLIFAGILYITAGGDPDRVKKARASIINVAIGLIVIFSAFLIVRFAVAIGNAILNAAG